MRVISGLYKGLKLDGHNISGTRPTMDRVKQSMMAMIQDKVKNSTCLDLFAGSGSLGIELLSMGAKKCYFVDNNKIAINTIYKNTARIEKEKLSVIQKDYNEALNYFGNNEITFDIIILDPPYDKFLVNNCLKKILDLKLLNEEGLIVIEYETETIETNNYDTYKTQDYGDKKVIILKKRQEI